MAIPKTEGRDEFRDALAPIVAALKINGERDYSREAALLTPGLDRAKLMMAVNRRTVYWPAVPALRKLLEARNKTTKNA